MKPSTATALHQVELAMARVENAQRELERAAQDLSSLRHGSDLCTKASKLRDACHKFFYTLRKASDSRNGMSKDSECAKCGGDLSGWRMGMAPHRCDGPASAAQAEGGGA